jgi:ComF family protein
MKSVFRRVVALVLPPRCPGCGTLVEDAHRFCAGCWASLRFLGPPWCAGCNVPFAYDRGEGARCAECLQTPPRHSGVQAAVAYGDVARTLALRLKYARRTGFAETMARLMARGAPVQSDLLIPVPLHRWRLWARGFNQAAVIADALGRLTDMPVDRMTLERTRRTPVLRGLNGAGRAKALRGAFRVARPERVRGQAVVLVDDVYTSGATTEGCTAALLRAGATSVTILCWARVLPDDAVD